MHFSVVILQRRKIVLNESEFIHFFVQKLISAGFPENTIAVEYQMPNIHARAMIDVAIVDLITNKILLMFEIKKGGNESAYKKAKENGERYLLHYISLLKDSTIPVYLVITKGSEDFDILPFEIEKDEKDEKRILKSAIPIDNLTSYTVLSNKSIISTIATNSVEIKKNIDGFKIVCWICAGIAIILAGLDIFKIITLSNTQVALIGVAIALVIMPFSKKLKILGVEFERLIAERPEHSKDTSGKGKDIKKLQK